MKGLGWLVGDGESINMWDDPWLSTTEPLRPYEPRPQQLPNLLVSDLISPSTKSWNWSLIQKYLPTYEDHIKRLNLGFTRHRDSLVWLPTKNGTYSTRSGYGLIKLDYVPNLRPKFNWQKKLWRLKTQPKIKFFIWKASVDALPVGEKLIRRGIGDHPVCTLCGETETTVHALFHCQWATQVWSLAPTLQINWTSISSVLEFLTEAPRASVLPPIGITTQFYFLGLLGIFGRRRTSWYMRIHCFQLRK